MFKAFKTLQSGSAELNRIQDNISNAIDPVVKLSILNGHLLRDVVLVSGASQITPHKLDRRLVGYFVTKRNANSVIWDEQATNLNPELTLNLRASANVTVDLWVF
jgi:hypothetical protein